MSDKSRQTIGIVVLGVCLLVGGGIIWMFIGSGPSKGQVKVDPAQQTPDMSGRNFARPPRPQQRIDRDADDLWTVRGATGLIRVKKQPAGNYRLTILYSKRDFLSPEQAALVSGAVRACNDEAMAREWGIAPEQFEKLKKIDLSGWLVTVSDADRQEMQKLWDAYMKAGDGSVRADAERKIITRLDELALNNLEASRKAFGQRLDEVRKVLTPEQVERIAKR